MPTADLPSVAHLLRGYGLVAPITVTRPIRFPFVKYEAGVGVEEATTNNIHNPSVEIAQTGWNAYVGFIERTIERASRGVTSVKCTPNPAIGVTQAGGYTDAMQTIAAGQPFTISADMWIPPGRTHGQLLGRDNTNNDSFFSISIVATPGRWTRLVASGTVPAGRTLQRVYIVPCTRIGTQPDLAADEFGYFDAVQVEQKSYATSYADGSLGTGYAWTGVPGASTSIRTAGILSFASPIAAPPITIVGWYRPEHASTFPSSRDIASVSDGTTSERYRLVIGGGSGAVIAQKTVATVAASASASVGASNAGALIFGALTYDGADLKAYGSRDGGAIVSATVASTTLPTGLDEVHIGHTGTGTPANGAVEQVLIYNVVLTAAEISALAARTMPLDFVDDSRIVFAAATPTTRGQTKALTVAGTGLYRSARTVDFRHEPIDKFETEFSRDITATHRILVPAGSGISEGEYLSLYGTDRWQVTGLWAPGGLYDELYIAKVAA